jgi:enoyl-CoA hydratase/carnithine racemase
VNQVVTDADLLATARAKAQQLAEKPPQALRTTKMLLKWGQAEVIRQAMSREGKLFAALLEGPEAKEALAAFLERRKPDFSRF